LNSQNRDLIINYYLYSDHHNFSDEEKHILVFLKTAWLSRKTIPITNTVHEKIKVPEISSIDENEDELPSAEAKIYEEINLAKKKQKRNRGKSRRNGKLVTNCPHPDRKH